MTLPFDIPASIWYEPKHSDHPLSKIKYTIEAVVENMDGTVLKYKSMLVIQEQPVEFKEGDIQSKSLAVMSCCCSSGSTNMEVKFNKNIFFSNETAEATIKLDNRLCTLKIMEVEFRVL